MSLRFPAPGRKRTESWALPAGWILELLLALAVLLPASAATNSSVTSSPTPPEMVDSNTVARAVAAYFDARDRWQASTNDAVVAWRYSRACFELAEYAPNPSRRAQLAQQGMAAAEASLTRSNSAPAHYWLGMNLGQLARTRGLGALRLVGRIRKEFEAAAALDPAYDYAGPHRNLGYLFRDTPPLISAGDAKAARRHLEKAVALAGTYPENRLAYLEGLLKWDDLENAAKELDRIDDLWPKAKAEFAGDEWVESWRTWEAQLAQLRELFRRKSG